MKLIAEEGQAKGLVFSLEAAVEEGKQEWYIGRDPDLASLQVADPKVSRQHALLTHSGNDYILENLSLTNPILINQVPLTGPTPLHEGDRIKIGGTTFLFTEKDIAPPAVSTAISLQDEMPYSTIFEEGLEDEKEDASTLAALDLEVRERWLIKIISGPQMGAEFSMTPGRSYVIGSDAATCDVILYDLSVSRRHAKISVDESERCFIEDLESRNGVLVDSKQIAGKVELSSGRVVSLGTTSFVTVDRETASETIIAGTLPAHEEAPSEVIAAPGEAIAERPLLSKLLSSKESFILFVLLTVLVLLFGYGVSTLFHGEEEVVPEKDIHKDLTQAMTPFPDVTYSYNKSTGALFLVGHVLTIVDKSQLEYNLKGFKFIAKLDDTNVVVDQLIWQEMNNLLARNPNWSGISMHAARPSVFVISGYLKTRAEAANLSDYLNLNFNYLDKLQNKVAVEENIIAQINAELIQQGLNGVTVQVNNGEVILAGFIADDKQEILNELMARWKEINGVREIKDFVAVLGPKEAVVNLSDRYQVTGFSTQDNTNINVLINGRILARGDTIDGMEITSIQANEILLEKDGLKFKIEYNP